MGITESGIVGYSTGEIAASYADGCTTHTETMQIAYHVGKTILDNKLLSGMEICELLHLICTLV